MPKGTDSRSVETLLTDLRHAGFPDIALLTDRGYESIQNLDEWSKDDNVREDGAVFCVEAHT